MIPKEAIEVREYVPASETEKGFVYSTWLKNYKFSSYFAKRIKHAVFYKGHHQIVTHILEKPEVKTFVANPKNDPDTILGFLTCETGEKPVVHFVFVKDAFRKMGVATALMRHAEIDPSNLTFTHWTLPVDELIRKFPEMIYDPYKL